MVAVQFMLITIGKVPTYGFQDETGETNQEMEDWLDNYTGMNCLHAFFLMVPVHT